MARRNKDIDVFKYIEMNDGDVTKCWEWTGALGGRDGRPYFSFGGKRMLAYRLVYEIFTGNVLTKDLVVRHECDNKVCCNPHHLTHGTHQENMNDMKERERHGLPHNTVKAIKRLLDEGEFTQQLIAKQFGVSRQTITAINNGEVYTHVTTTTDDKE